MYLSRLCVDVTTREAIRLVSSPYRVHAAVEGSFSENAVRRSEQGRILWRLDPVPGDSSALWLYVVSPEQPDFSLIVEQCGLPAETSWETRDYSKLLDYVSEGQSWGFRLKANPARKVLRDQGTVPNERVIGTIQGHVTVEQQLKWLLDRAAKHGFEIPTGEAGAREVRASSRHRERYRRHDAMVTIDTAVYDGVLCITDADQFRKTLGFGIGRAKGLGCGLLTIAPIRREGTHG